MSEINKSIRLKTTPGGEDTHLTLKLEQNFDFLEVLSLKISQQELYNNFCANYGTIVGRVIANKGFGVPNAKVSVFIPIDSEDEKNELIKNLYPYNTIERKDGVRYNLLLSKETCDLNVAVGTFPTKEELLNDDIMIEVFEKYYKYTTKTNESGDYMLFGVPTGERIVHMDVDLSDAGLLSVRPYDLISQGAPVDFFDGPTKFKQSTNIDVLPQVKTVNRTVDVIPFWGDPETCELGITRADIDTNVELEPTALFTGSIYSDTEKSSLNKRCNPTNDMGELDLLRTGAGNISFIRATKINPIDWVVNKKIVPTKLEYFEYKGGNVIDDDGSFVIPLPMNVGRVITNENGDLVPSDDPEVGLPTKGSYRMKIKFNEPPVNQKRRTANMIFPSLPETHGGSAGYTSNGNINDIGGTEDQRFTDNINDYKDIEKDFHLFEWKQLYTIAQYIKKYKKGSNRWSFLGLKNTDKDGAANNPLPFNTAVKKPDFLYGLGSFFLQIGAFIIKFIILLIGLEFGFYFGLKLSVLGIDIIKFYRIIRIAPFGWVGNILGKFSDDAESNFCSELYDDPEARGFSLDCDGTTYCIRTDSGGDLCGDSGGVGCCESDCGNISFIGTSDACGCGPVNAGDCNNGVGCDEPLLCLRPYFFSPNVNNCEALNTVDSWLCCRIIELAEKRNVIRRCLFDAWVIGSSYLFQYKYKSKQKIKNDVLIKKEKFCGPGSDTKGGNNYHKNQCCPHDDGEFFNPNFENGSQIGNEPGPSCAKCLIRGAGESDKNYGNIEPYHKTWHNATVNGNCNGQSCGNGATDIGDNIYCNVNSPTKIVSLGRVEMCPDTLNAIENCIQATECVFDLYKQTPEFFTGTFYEEGWDPNFWVNEMGPTSYQNPVDVLKWLVTQTNCNVTNLFEQGQGCHENELKNENYQWIKEISKIYTDIITVQTSASIDDEQFLPGSPSFDADEDDDGLIISGYEFDNTAGQRFNPCAKTNTSPECNQPPFLPWSGIDEQTIDFGPGANHNGSRNIPYYYFGITPGKTAIDKLRNEFFVN